MTLAHAGNSGQLVKVFPWKEGMSLHTVARKHCLFEAGWVLVDVTVRRGPHHRPRLVLVYERAAEA